MPSNHVVLAVNDNPDQLEVLQVILQQAGFRVATAFGGNEGFDAARRELPDLIISDVMMPDGDGLELCRLIRADAALQSTPILLLSGLRKDMKSVVEGIALGADDYLEIPYDAMYLVAKATRMIERRQTERALRANDNRFRSLIENSRDIISILTSDGTIVYESPALEYVLGYAPDELIGKNAFDLIYPEDAARVNAFFNQALQNIDAAGQVEYRFRHKDNSWRILESLGRKFNDPADGLVVIVNSRDVTEQRKALESKREAEDTNRFQAHLLDTVEQAVIATDLDGIVTYWNGFAQRLYGWSAEEAVGRAITSLTTPEGAQAEANEIISRLKEDGKSWAGDFTVRRKNGETFPARVFNSPISDAGGGAIGIVGISFDITDQRRADEALRQAEIRYRSLVELSPAIVYLAEPFLPFAPIYVSPNVEVFGYQSEEWFACADMWLTLIHEEDRERVIQNTKDAIKQGLNTEIEYRIVARDRQIHWVHDKGCFIRDEQGNAIGWQGVILDVTETKKLEEQLRLSQKLESVGRLAGGIAHDFNNMLTVINGYSAIILKQIGGDHPLSPKVLEIKKAGERSALLTHQLLAFSRQQILKPRILNINEIIVDTSNMLQRLIGEDIQLNILPDPKAGQIEVDPGQLTQVIMNLAVNARDAMPDGGNLTIETANVYLDEETAALFPPTLPGFYVLLTIGDTGSGISDDVKQHIFEPFYTTKEIGKGTGLGLATVYGIIKQSGGYIWAESEAGKGATFRIYFPRADKQSAQAEAGTVAAEVSGGSETILLVEDEEIVRNLAREILETCDYKVIEAENGIEALEICRKPGCKIDLLITDVVMPKMGGREVAEKVAEIFPDIPQLFISGYTNDGIFREGLIKEDMNFIQKPFTFEALTHRVRKLLDEKKS